MRNSMIHTAEKFPLLMAEKVLCGDLQMNPESAEKEAHIAPPPPLRRFKARQKSSKCRFRGFWNRLHIPRFIFVRRCVRFLWPCTLSSGVWRLPETTFLGVAEVGEPQKQRFLDPRRRKTARNSVSWIRGRGKLPETVFLAIRGSGGSQKRCFSVPRKWENGENALRTLTQREKAFACALAEINNPNINPLNRISL